MISVRVSVIANTRDIAGSIEQFPAKASSTILYIMGYFTLII